jgi:dihydropyrimidinase
MHLDTAIINGTAVFPRQTPAPATIAIADGRIAAVLEPERTVEADEIIDASGMLIFPGLIEPHMHIGFVGGPLSDIASESRSAAIGGVTTILNYLLKPEPYDEPFKEFVSKIDELAYVDFGLHLGVFSDQHIREIEHYIRDFGVTSFKFFMSYKGEEAPKRGLTPVDDGLLYAMLTEVARHPGAVANVHAENIEIIWRHERSVRAAGIDGLAAHYEARPGFAEATDVTTACYFGQLTGAPLYFVHMSSYEAVNAVRPFHHTGNVFVETTPHYLSLTIDSPCGLLAKVNPPVRTQRDIDALWRAIDEGIVDTIGCDHFPSQRVNKMTNVWQSASAFPGVGTMLALLMTEGYYKRGVRLERIAELTSYNTARIFNLYPRKGSLLVGSDADIAIVDPGREMVVNANYLQSRADHSPWEGWRLRGWTVRTLVRGRTIMQDGEILNNPGYGTYLHRSLPARRADELAAAPQYVG